MSGDDGTTPAERQLAYREAVNRLRNFSQLAGADNMAQILACVGVILDHHLHEIDLSIMATVEEEEEAAE